MQIHTNKITQHTSTTFEYVTIMLIPEIKQNNGKQINLVTLRNLMTNNLLREFCES